MLLSCHWWIGRQLATCMAWSLFGLGLATLVVERPTAYMAERLSTHALLFVKLGLRSCQCMTGRLQQLALCVCMRWCSVAGRWLCASLPPLPWEEGPIRLQIPIGSGHSDQLL